ncbi:MAG: MGMT family protein [Nitriliruptoraceae bacterium]
MAAASNSVHVPSRVQWVKADTVITDTIDVTHSVTLYGDLFTASVNDTLLEAAFCHTTDDQTCWHDALRARFAPININTVEHSRWAQRILTPDEPVNIITPATPFRQAVHTVLASVPYGTTVTYASLAEQLGAPKATRAVASAVAANRIAVVIPCHRVWRSDGTPGEFRWGKTVKTQLCDNERSAP